MTSLRGQTVIRLQTSAAPAPARRAHGRKGRGPGMLELVVFCHRFGAIDKSSVTKAGRRRISRECYGLFASAKAIKPRSEGEIQITR